MLVDVRAIRNQIEQTRRQRQLALASTQDVSHPSRISHGAPVELNITIQKRGAVDPRDGQDAPTLADIKPQAGEPSAPVGEKGTESGLSHPSQNSLPPNLQLVTRADPAQFPSTLYLRLPLVAEGVGLLDPERPRGSFNHERWREVVADAKQLLKHAHKGGPACRWADVFGVQSFSPDSDASGLVVRMRGREIGMFNGVRGRLKPHGASDTVPVEDLITLEMVHVRNAVMLWDLPEQCRSEAGEVAS